MAFSITKIRSAQVISFSLTLILASDDVPAERTSVQLLVLEDSLRRTAPTFIPAANKKDIHSILLFSFLLATTRFFVWDLVYQPPIVWTES